jgi:hypothetical protein
MDHGKEAITIVETATTASGEKHDETIVIKRADDALDFAAEAEDLVWSPREERRVIAKIDTVILFLVSISGWKALATTHLTCHSARSFSSAQHWDTLMDRPLVMPGSSA